MKRTSTDVLALPAETLPAYQQARGEGAQRKSTPEQARPPRILLVDDDSCMLGIQSRMLRNMGYPETTAAGSANDALLQLEHDPHSAEVIVCDLNMPDMDGIEFLQTLNASPFRGSVILLSGNSRRILHSVQKLLGGGQLVILGALTKPAGRDALRAMLECWRPLTAPRPTAPKFVFTADDLRVANRERQWVLHYQPQVDVRSGALVGMEALVRWNHPEYGLVYPDQFIAATEERGAIDDLTDWVVQDALQQRARWHAQGLKLQMSVNVSMQSICAPDFWRRFCAFASKAGGPQNLTLEVTESRIMTSSRVSLENFVRLRLQGFTLSIDDFGTGHSSLTQLCDIPFDELKVDRSFVNGASNDQIIRPILEGSLGIAKRMGMTSVAEGVESRGDWQLLRDLDCDRAQGYFIGRPMRVEAVEEWLTVWQGRLAHLVEGQNLGKNNVST